jgi:hypothetical protein
MKLKNIIWNHFMWLFFYPGKTGFVTHRLLWLSKAWLVYIWLLDIMRGMRLGFLGPEWGSSFHWVKRYVKEGCGK